MRSVEGGDEGDTKRRKVEPLRHEGDAEVLSWAIRWVNNSNLRKSLEDPSLTHLFRC